MDKKCNVKTLQKVQRTCCLGICGAMRTTPTRAMETILYIHPIDIQIKYEAAVAALRLKAMDEWIDTGHNTLHKNI